MRYLDTSLLVAALTREDETERMQEWLAAADPNELAISDWVTTEFSAALSVKLRSSRISIDERADVSVTSRHFLAAARFADQHGSGLRAGDALHVAIAAEYGADLYTLDARLAEAGPALGVRTHLL
jgi:uncharacterized protein